jgi:hypothetical protein
MDACRGKICCKTIYKRMGVLISGALQAPSKDMI